MSLGSGILAMNSLVGVTGEDSGVLPLELDSEYKEQDERKKAVLFSRQSSAGY